MINGKINFAYLQFETENSDELPFEFAAVTELKNPGYYRGINFNVSNTSNPENTI